MIYDSTDDDKIYQSKPIYSKPSHFKEKGWTESTLGYINEARQWAICVLRNRKLMRRPYTWVVHLNLNEVLPPLVVRDMWPKVCRKLNERGIVCLWVREANRLNKVHYHILIKRRISKADLANAIEDSMPSRTLAKWRKRIEPIKNEWRLVHYMFKAKLMGHSKKGDLVDDLYAKKRLLFKPHLKFKKAGTIGDFWEHGKSKKKLWNDIKAIEKRIGEGLEMPNVKRLCEHVHHLLGECVPIEKIERALGSHARWPAIQNWIDELLGKRPANPTPGFQRRPVRACLRSASMCQQCWG